MKYFAYDYSERFKSGNTYRTVHIYTVKRNILKHVATETELFVSEFQLVLMTMEKHKLLPKRAFEKNPNGSHKYGVAWLLLEAGIANIQRI